MFDIFGEVSLEGSMSQELIAKLTGFAISNIGSRADDSKIFNSLDSSATQLVIKTLQGNKLVAGLSFKDTIGNKLDFVFNTGNLGFDWVNKRLDDLSVNNFRRGNLDDIK